MADLNGQTGANKERNQAVGDLLAVHFGRILLREEVARRFNRPLSNSDASFYLDELREFGLKLLELAAKSSPDQVIDAFERMTEPNIEPGALSEPTL